MVFYGPAVCLLALSFKVVELFDRLGCIRKVHSRQFRG